MRSCSPYNYLLVEPHMSTHSHAFSAYPIFSANRTSLPDEACTNPIFIVLIHLLNGGE